MKNLLIILVLVSAQSVLAHGPLLDAMKDMGTNFRIVAVGLQSGVMTTTELEASEKLQMAIANASLHYPSTASTDALKIKYSKWMAELNKYGLELEETIEVAMTQNPQDLTDVTTVFGDMNDLRRKGHDEFKEEH